MSLFSRSFALAGAFLLAATAASAQAPAAKSACDITDAAKGNVARSTLTVDLARQAGPGPIATSNLKNAVKLLETAEKGGDEVSRAYVLGTALSLWLNQPGITPVTKRSNVGFTTMPEATIDLVTSLDSLFRIVEAAKPLCSDYTSFYRGGQKFYLDQVNGAINALNADKLDSAEAYATLAGRLYPASPYSPMVIGSVYSKRGNSAKAIEYWTRASEAAGKDTTYREVRRQMLTNIGSVQIAAARSAAASERMVAARTAAETYAQLLAVPGTTGSFLYSGRANYQAALLLAGDTAAALKSLEPLLANRAAYEYQDLLNSAVTAARIGHAAEAATLFEGVLQQNPNNRDALFNSAVSYLTLNQNDRVAPIVTRLIALDPSNPENYYLAARAYVALGKAARAAKNSPLNAAYNDTSLAWYNRGTKLTAEVSFTEFTPGDKQIIIGGSVTDRREKADQNAFATPAPAKTAKARAAAAAPVAKTYPAKPVTIQFESLDRNGAVVGRQSVTTEALTPDKSAKFTVTIPGANAVAFRYTVSP